MLKKIFIFAGECSGDLHGALLVKALRERLPQLHLWGVAGPQMRQEGVSCFVPMEEFQVMGIQDVLLALPRLYRHLKQIRNELLSQNPDAVVLIDYADFNMRLAKALRSKGYKGKIVHYICPSVWAWRSQRISQLAATLDLLLAIFPFEPAYFKDTPLRVEYIGNPLMQHLQEPQSRKNHSLIALFPGSRQGEVERNLDLQLKTVLELKKEDPELTFVISVAQPALEPIILEKIASTSLHFGKDITLVPATDNQRLMQECSAALAKSGTVTLELALQEVPTVVMYQLSFVNWLFAKFIFRIKLPYYCIANIIAQKTVFPEYIHDAFNPSMAAASLKKLYRKGSEREQCLSLCKEVKELLKSPSPPADMAAELIVKQIHV